MVAAGNDLHFVSLAQVAHVPGDAQGSGLPRHEGAKANALDSSLNDYAQSLHYPLGPGKAPDC